MIILVRVDFAYWLPQIMTVFAVGQIPLVLMLWPAIRTRNAQGRPKPKFKLVTEPTRASQSPLHDNNIVTSTEEAGGVHTSPQVQGFA